jgi:STE24 endopeptidase
MPLSALAALFLAFGLDSPLGGVPHGDVSSRVLEACAGVLLVAALAFGLGFWVARTVSQRGYATTKLRRFYLVGVRFLTVLSLAVYAWILYELGWAGLVSTNWGLGGLFLIDDLAVILPYLVIQGLVWSGLYLAERAVQYRPHSAPSPKLLAYLLLKSRHSFGLLLPVVLVFLLRNDLIPRFWPLWARHPLSEPVDLAVLGGLVLTASPLFVRLAWPTRSLPAGPLRRRLERVADRAGFRFRDVLVWDTGHVAVNACVTGILPGFRYVLLTDALIESLSPQEIAAVFGHEIGHVAHRHLPFFGLFFLGVLGLLTVSSELVANLDRWVMLLPGLTSTNFAFWSEIAQTCVILGLLALVFFGLFGPLSRRFERQADIFGCRMVSCGERSCPPHSDIDAWPAAVQTTAASARPQAGQEINLCPVGIRVFADALESVARQNGIERRARSWRHGSIARRVEFLESLEDNPLRERRFQSQMKLVRLGFGILLLSSIAWAIVSRVLPTIS